MKLTDGEFRMLVMVYHGRRRDFAPRQTPEVQSLLGKELLTMGYRTLPYSVAATGELTVTQQGEAALKNEPIRALRMIESSGAFKSSSSATHYLRQGVVEIIGSLAPCQLPELLSHEEEQMRYCAEKRLNECLQAKKNK